MAKLLHRRVHQLRAFFKERLEVAIDQAMHTRLKTGILCQVANTRAGVHRFVEMLETDPDRAARLHLCGWAKLAACTTAPSVEWELAADLHDTGELLAARKLNPEDGLGVALACAYLTRAPHVFMPEKPPSKDRWLTRSEVARLLRACWRNPRARHLARFVLVGIYSGTRKEVILGLQFVPSVGAGWIDTKAGLLYRRGQGAGETRKRRPTAKIPRQLLAHARRWERQGGRFVISHKGARVASIKTAWARATAEAGLEGVTPHTLRHTAITWAMQRGAAPADVAGYFGVSLEILERVYWHHHPDYQGSAVEAMEARVSVVSHRLKRREGRSGETKQGENGE